MPSTVTNAGMLDNIDVGFKDKMENCGLVTMATKVPVLLAPIIAPALSVVAAAMVVD